MKLSFLVDNKTERASCQAEWGLSIFVESGGHKVLFDTGCSDMFARNAKAMDIDLTEAEAVLISHGHFDHTEGMPAFAEINKTAPIYIHKNAFSVFHGTDGDEIEEYNCGLLWSREFTDSIRNRFVLTENVVKVNDCMTLIGNIPDFREYPPTEKFYKEVEVVNSCGDKAVIMEPDDMSHEQFLVVEEGEMIFIISGCSHRGVLPTIMTAQKYFPDKKIAALIAGMHMYPLADGPRKKLVQQIIDAGVEKVFPLHCTGMAAIIEFKARMGEGCVVASSGDVYEL
ncbi:MAG: MBL fold metallo-hydrolase [Firmicutes bacterium]|nr:MBL fold metallo-hydrolase [Bacillota bacterium]